MKNRRPLLIGITGNIGTGKSTVAKMLVELGVHAIDADQVAHEVMHKGTRVHKAIVEAFGPEVLASDGEIDRQRLGAIVFSDPTALARLEAIVHPATLDAIERCIVAIGADVVAVEAIKLIEAGMAKDCDSVWVTTCRPEQQVQRIVAARGLGQNTAEQRVRAQPPQELKIAQADVVIDTSGTLAETREQVRIAWERLAATMGT
jgi:dephospho-CoA kinase